MPILSESQNSLMIPTNLTLTETCNSEIEVLFESPIELTTPKIPVTASTKSNSSTVSPLIPPNSSKVTLSEKPTLSEPSTSFVRLPQKPNNTRTFVSSSLEPNSKHSKFCLKSQCNICGKNFCQEHVLKSHIEECRRKSMRHLLTETKNSSVILVYLHMKDIKSFVRALTKVNSLIDFFVTGTNVCLTHQYG